MPQRLSDVPLADLFPELRGWNNGRGIGLGEWVSGMGTFEHAIAYGELFWPDFVEHEGGVFRGPFDEGVYRDFKKQMGGDRQAVEAVMNHQHIVDLFCQPDLNPTRNQVVYLGRLLKEMWEAKLYREFPTRQITVSFSEEFSEDLLGYVVTFYQE